MSFSRFAGIATAFVMAALAFPLALGLIGPSDVPTGVLEKRWAGASVFLRTAGLHVLLIAVPLFYLLNRFGFIFRQRSNWLNAVYAVSAGFFIGALPSALFTAYGTFVAVPALNADVGGIPTVVDGVTTPYGIRLWFMLLVAQGGIGAWSGLVFWATLALLKCSSKVEIAAASQDLSRDRHLAGIRALALVVAVAVLVAVLSAPTLLKDTSCHNPLPRGMTSNSPKASMNLEINRQEWAELARFLEDYARRKNLSFRDNTKYYGSDPRFSLSVSLCTEKGFHAGIHWLSFGRPRTPLQNITIFEVREQSDWLMQTRPLFAELMARWPDAAKFYGSDRKPIPMPSVLREPAK